MAGRWNQSAWLPRSAIVALAAGLLCTCGCTHVITQTADYYKKGPSQLDGPDGVIEEGTQVWVVGRDGSYVRVWSAAGVNAHVWDRSVTSIWDHNQQKRKDDKARKAAEKRDKKED